MLLSPHVSKLLVFYQEGSSSPGPDMYIDSEDDESESEDDDLSYDDYYDDEQDESIEGSDVDASDELLSETNSETGDSAVNDEYDKVRVLVKS